MAVTQTQPELGSVGSSLTSRMPTAVLVAAGVVAFSSVAYELLLASYATYLLGATIFQYSLVISLMMFTMGLGALLVHRVKQAPLVTFVSVEILLALVAAAALPILYWVFAEAAFPRFTLILFVTLIGLGIGMEVPLLSEMEKSPSALSKILFSTTSAGLSAGLCFLFS